ncbi:alpha/beta fold hydrolase [Pendulispora brunnea]|uniref:Alpha/beta fold hydrolase n=1 Tax=Pendulispora brunnea TaxID=2905690 RepID=A0ABZ2KGQ3_9BACT
MGGGSELHYHREGSGEPLVLIHGIGSRHGVWRPVVEQLARQRDVFAIDLPGFGASPPLPEGTPSGIPTLTDAVEAWIRAMGLDRPHVAGNSLGGAIALELARRNAVRSATALSPAGFWIPIENTYARFVLKTARALGRRARPLGPRLAHSNWARGLLAGPFVAYPSRMDPEEALLDLAAFLDGPAFDETLDRVRGYAFANGHELRVPVTIAWGTRDYLLFPHQARRARRLLPDARHVSLRGCGHMPMGDDPKQVLDVLLFH